MTITGKCHCGAVSYAVDGDPIYEALCHCSDCRRHAGAPMVGWTAFPADAVTVTGETKVYASSDHGRRQFCGRCGTGLFYTNDVALPGLFDVQSSTFDDPAAHPPSIQVQCAERLPWMENLDRIACHDRYPAPE